MIEVIYRLSAGDFFSIKKDLDGIVAYQVCDNSDILVKPMCIHKSSYDYVINKLSKYGKKYEQGRNIKSG